MVYETLNYIINQLEKDENGAITTILILAIINFKGKTWGYEIKKILREITNSQDFIKDSTLYTKLKEAEKEKLVVTEREKETPRKYYILTPQGENALKKAVEYWVRRVKKIYFAFGKLSIIPAQYEEAIP